MQKVVGSSPIIRSSENPAQAGFFFAPGSKPQPRRAALVRFWSGSPVVIEGDYL